VLLIAIPTAGAAAAIEGRAVSVHADNIPAGASMLDVAATRGHDRAGQSA